MLANLLHLHGFKCAGSTFIWSLERATKGDVLYLESPGAGDRLDWRLARDYLATLERQPQAITSHLICLPPPGAVAALKVAFLREPIERIASAYRFQTQVQKTAEPVSFCQYLEGLQRGTLANFQTRHLSPQEPGDWVLRRGWAARPELIDLSREDLFVGLVERYDDSILALEDQLERMGMAMDLAYARPVNTTREAGAANQPMAPEARLAHTPLGLALTELDLSLQRRVEQRLEERLAAVSDLERKRAALQRRRAALDDAPPRVQLKPQAEWVNLPLPSA
ncbi:hypothetical protein I1E95_14625 [Synechococcus sp. CBW1107]|uniref:hypothetical protein n=1 Tax=Synechococcus sp. CBW1107 TaxID=2789857 RepID=UPI0018CCA9AB|nr:hypothetical protein [Synechococcus sp. CBW1107]QPN56308.1 hypothetical protein I1E95_14625 [Synechococcus sp. CBW1107]